MLSEAGVKDITWVTPSGCEATDEDWGNPAALSLGYILSGAAGEFFTLGGQRDIDESFLVMMNADHGDLDFRIPDLAAPMSWAPLVDTSRSTGRVVVSRRYSPGEVYRLAPHTFALFINRAPRPEFPRPLAEHSMIFEPVPSGEEQLGFNYEADDGEAELGDGDASAP